MNDMDMVPSEKILSERKIKKLLGRGEIELRCPSGLWRHADEVPDKLIVAALKKKQWYNFRKER